MTNGKSRRLAVVGGGPAGLMAAETARAAGVEVDLYESMGSVGRKFLLAGKGGLNLTHSEPRDGFVRRYAGRESKIGRWLDVFDNIALRSWASELGIKTVIGTSGRVFPSDFKAAPLLRGWVRRLRGQGVRFHVNHKCEGWDESGHLIFASPNGTQQVSADAIVFALGGGSWPHLGSDGRWVQWLASEADIAPLQAANCGFEVSWSQHFIDRHAGQPVKPVIAHWSVDGSEGQLQGEFVVTAEGVEGSLVYALSGRLREAISQSGPQTLYLDLVPGRDEARVLDDLSRPRGKRSMSEHLRRSLGLDGVKIGLLHEVVPKEDMADVARLARWIKRLPLVLQRPRPLSEAISTAGGVKFDAVDPMLMLCARPGVFCAGEMLDWEAPTGGYLLTACFASGRIAGQAAAEWLKAKE